MSINGRIFYGAIITSGERQRVNRVCHPCFPMAYRHNNFALGSAWRQFDPYAIINLLDQY